MTFFFLDVDETIIGTLADAVTCKVDEANLTAEMSFYENGNFSMDDVAYIGFEDIDGYLTFYEVNTTTRSSLDHPTIVSFDCEHAAMAELLQEIITGKAVQGATAGYAVNHLLEDTRWSMNSAETTDTISTSWYYETVWECLEDIIDETDCALYWYWTIDGNEITGRYVDVKARQGEARGKRFELTKDLQSITVEQNRSGIYTRLYGRGKGEEVGETEDGETTYGRRIDFGDIEWSTDDGDPVDKPLDQLYVEDEEATELFGRGPAGDKRPRVGVVIFSDCEDDEELLELTWEKLEQVCYPTLTITAKAIDLERVWGYSHEAIRMGDDVAVIADEWNAVYSDKIVSIVRDYVNPTETEITIGEEGSTTYSNIALLTSELEDTKETADIGASVAEANPDLLQGVIDTMVTEIMSSGSEISTDSSDGSLLLTATDGSSIVKITGSGILIANSKTGASWDWVTAINGDGIVADQITTGVLQASLIKILGTTQFYWDASNIYIIDPNDSAKQIKIGLYDGVNYGIGFTTDDGVTWTSALSFDGLTLNYNTIIQQVMDSDEMTEALEITKYVRISEGQIILGQSGNEIVLTIENDRLSFTQNGEEVAYMTNNEFVNTNVTVTNRLRLGVFGFVPRSDGSLMFLKVGEATDE